MSIKCLFIDMFGRYVDWANIYATRLE